MNLMRFELFESRKSLSDFCVQNNIQNWTINEEGLIDVDGDVDISATDLKKIPFKFGKIKGSFDCKNNQLTTLENSPIEVEVDFNCNGNNLKSLKGAPKKVGRQFYCRENKLVDLKGAPEFVVGSMCCHDNEIYEIGIENGDFDWLGNLYLNACPLNDIYKFFGWDEQNFYRSMDFKYIKKTRGGEYVIDRRRWAQACEEQGLDPDVEFEYYKFV